MKAHINGIDFHYEVHGAGQAVLFVHGFPLSHRLWTPMVERLSDVYTLIMPDLRGMGQTEATETCTMAMFADDLKALLDHVGVTEPVVVVGMSMGGYIAFEFFRRHRQCVRALVLADTRCQADPPEIVQVRVKTAARVLAEGSKVVADGMIDLLFAPGAPETLRKEWHEIMVASSPVGVAAALDAMAKRVDSTATLPQIDVPTLVVVGENDAITPPRDAEFMHAAIPNARLEIIPEVGHMSPVENPQRFADAVRRVLTDAIA